MKFGYTILYVKNVERTIGFHEEAFGLKRRFALESGYGELGSNCDKLTQSHLCGAMPRVTDYLFHVFVDAVGRVYEDFVRRHALVLVFNGGDSYIVSRS